jgi:CheY-like chemotaxis protein
VYDVILMDMSMPIMDGLEAARLIGARRRDNASVDNDFPTPPPPMPRIVFVTAHVSADFQEQCRQAGGCGFLAKPFKVNEIETLMRRICEEMEMSQNVDEEMEKSRGNWKKLDQGNGTKPNNRMI